MKAPIPHRADLPPELTKRRFWINWRFVWKENEQKWTKVPWSAEGAPIVHTDPKNWLMFSQALKLAKDHQLGVGFVLSKSDPYAGMDFDDCFVADDELHPAARELASGVLGKTYAEVTPSNNGLRVLVRHSKNGSRCKNEHAPWGGKFEFYDNGRFFTTTGWGFEESPLEIGVFPSEVSRIEAEALGPWSQSGNGAGQGLRQRRERPLGRRKPEDVGDKERHNTYISLAGGLWNEGYSEQAIFDKVKAFNEAVPDPMPASRFDEEVWRAIRYIADKSADADAEFWGASKLLTHVQEFAQARRVAPLAVLGCLLAQLAAFTSPLVRLPGLGLAADEGDTIDTCALNLFVGLVGQPGDGKDLAEKVARAAVEFKGYDLSPKRPSSGESFAHIFKRYNTKDGVEHWRTHNALAKFSEVEWLTTTSARKGSTLMSELRNIFSGGATGGDYADRSKTLHVPEGEYALGLIVGMQPAKTKLLLEDSGGGTPQRFLFLQTADRYAPDRSALKVGLKTRSVTPAFLDLAMGQDPEQPMSGEPHVMEVCEQAYLEVDADRVARLTRNWEAIPYDPQKFSHRLLVKEKVAGLLALMHGAEPVSKRWWEHADWIMARSDEGFALCEHAVFLENQQRRQAAKTQHAEAAVEATNALETNLLEKTCASVRRQLAKAASADGSSWRKRRQLRDGLPSRDMRPMLPSALEKLLADGAIVELEEGNGHFAIKGAE